MIRGTIQYKKQYILFMASLACMFFFFPFIKKNIFNKHFNFDDKEKDYITSYFFAGFVQYILLGIIIFLGIVNHIYLFDISYYLQIFFISFLFFWIVLGVILVGLNKQFIIWQYITKYKNLKKFFFDVFFENIKDNIKIGLNRNKVTIHR